MDTSDISNVLIVGIDASALAASAKKAGYAVYAADYFGDSDLQESCEDTLSVIKQEAGKSCGRIRDNFSPDIFLSLAKKLLSKHQIDLTLLASGLEDSPQILAELNEIAPIAGTKPRAIEKVRNRPRFFDDIERLHIHHPRTAKVESFQDGRRAAKDIGYPVVVKPLSGFGGAGVMLAKNEAELAKALTLAESQLPGALIQEFVEGLNISISVLSSQEGSSIMTVNEQLLGISELGQKKPFGYCGNIVPASDTDARIETLREIAEKISSYSGLVGSNGIDLVISKDNVPYVVEVNPRFQGSLECVERVLRMNLVNAHMNAFVEGTLPTVDRKRPGNCCVRLILYALRRSIVPNLQSYEYVRDASLPGAVIEAGEPLCSIIIEEKTKSVALRKAMRLTEFIYSSAGSLSTTGH